MTAISQKETNFTISGIKIDAVSKMSKTELKTLFGSCYHADKKKQ